MLELRNTSRESETGSPMQRLIGKRGKTLLLITANLRKPDSIDPRKVQSKLLDYRQKQKFYYDKDTKPKEEIKPSDAIKINTPKGWKPAEFLGKTQYPRSYTVNAHECGHEYRRNSEMLIKTNINPHVVVAKEPKIPIMKIQIS